MSKVQQRKKYDQVELKPLASNENDFDDDQEYKTKSDQWLNWALFKLHALLWIIIASALALYTQLFEVIVDGHPPADPSRQLNRCVLLDLRFLPPFVSDATLRPSLISASALAAPVVPQLFFQRRPLGLWRLAAHGHVPYRLPQVHQEDRSRVGGLLASGHSSGDRDGCRQPSQLLRCLLAGVGMADATLHLYPLLGSAQPRALCAAMNRSSAADAVTDDIPLAVGASSAQPTVCAADIVHRHMGMDVGVCQMSDASHSCVGGGRHVYGARGAVWTCMWWSARVHASRLAVPGARVRASQDLSELTSAHGESRDPGNRGVPGALFRPLLPYGVVAFAIFEY